MVFLFVIESGWAQSHASGAFAVNPDVPGQYGFTFGKDSPEEAEKYALHRCGGGCEIVDVYSRGCGVYAIDEAQDGIVLGYASSRDRDEAQAAALKNCEARGGTACKIGKTGCNFRRRGSSK
jgi:hypothetical protein